jgi:DNA-binding beta-propeller fold protein YncE
VAVCRTWFPSVLTLWRGRAAVAAAIGAVALASAAPAALAGTTAKAAAQRVIATVRVGNGSTSLAVDPRTGAVYVVNEGSRTVTVISGRANKVAITVPIKESSGVAPCGVMVSPVTGDVYISSRVVTGSTKQVPVIVLSGRTNKVIGTIGGNVFVDAISPVTGDVYLLENASNGAGTVKVLSGLTNKVIATIPGVSGGTAINPRTGEVYLASFPISGLVKVVNGRTNKVTATITVDAPPPDGNPQNGTYPESIAVSPVTGDAYVFSTGFRQPNSLTVINGQTNKIITTVSPAPEGLGSVELGVGRTGTVYVAGNATNTIAVINGQTNQTINTIDFNPVAGDEGFTEFAISPQTGDAYVPDIVFRISGHEEYNAVVGVSAISAQTGKIVSTIRLPRAVGNGQWLGLYTQYRIAVSPVTGDVYSLNPVNAQTSNPYPQYEVSVLSS